MNAAEATIRELLGRRLLVLDGAMGTMIQRRRLGEADFRGARFARHARDLGGDTDVLVLTRPDVVSGIHDAYFAAGADIVETNTFGATAVVQADYGLEGLVYEMNVVATRLAKERASEWTRRTPRRPRFVAGAMGPTNEMLSRPPRVAEPGVRAATFDQVCDAYAEQVRGLVDGGADLLLLETFVDTLNAQAALAAAENVFDQRGVRLPVIVSMAFTDESGRTLSGQTAEAFWTSVAGARPLAVGINCALGVRAMRPHIAALAACSDAFVSCHPSAGLPNARGEYDETPDVTASFARALADEGLVNIVGGCCGTTPDHVRAIAERVAGSPPRAPPRLPR